MSVSGRDFLKQGAAAVGAAGSTGRGEANLYNLCSFLIVENLRRGMHPQGRGTRRARAGPVEHGRAPAATGGEPNFSLTFYILNARGEHAGVSMYGEDVDYSGWAGNPADRGFMKYAVCDAKGPRLEPCEPLLPGVNKGD